MLFENHDFFSLSINKEMNVAHSTVLFFYKGYLVDEEEVKLAWLDQAI